MTPRERYEAACAALLYVTKAAWVRWEDTTIDCRLTLGSERMSDQEWIDAVRKRRRASARWGYPHDLSDVRAEGRVVGYSGKPMVLIETDSGEQLWWAAELTVIEEPTTPPSQPETAPRTDAEASEVPEGQRDAESGVCAAGVGGGEVCMRPAGHDGDHDPDSTEVAE